MEETRPNRIGSGDQLSVTSVPRLASGEERQVKEVGSDPGPSILNQEAHDVA